MAQNDVIKEIVFIADEGYEAPGYAWATALASLLVLALAEVLTIFVSQMAGMIVYGLILIALLVQYSIGIPKRANNFLVVLSIIPLIRLLAMTIPPVSFDPVYWYLLVAALLGVLVFISARLAGMSSSSMGLQVAKKELPAQLLIGMTGVTIGLVEYLILRPEPVLPGFGSGILFLASMIFLLFAGLLQEVIFRGLLQISSVQIMDRFGIVYVAVIFTLQSLVFRSLWNTLFVFLVGLGFGIIVARTRSLVGVSLSHGMAYISLFLIFPSLVAATTTKVDAPVSVVVPIHASPTPTATLSPTRAMEPVEEPPLVLIPATGPTATPSPTVTLEIQATCGMHPNWVVYVSQSGDTVESISVQYEIEPDELRNANCFTADFELSAGQGFFVPFDLIISPTPTLPFVFSPLNPPTATPTQKPARKEKVSSTRSPVQEVTPIPGLPTRTPLPTTNIPAETPTLAPTQEPIPPPAPTQEN